MPRTTWPPQRRARPESRRALRRGNRGSNGASVWQSKRVCALPFETFDQVIGRANDTRFGLAGGVWTSNIDTARHAIKAIRAGSIWVNQYQVMDPNVPFGGYKMSGYGREGGLEHLEAYLNTKTMWIRTG